MLESVHCVFNVHNIFKVCSLAVSSGKVIITSEDIYFYRFLLMPQLCWTVFTVHSLCTIFFKPSLIPLFGQLVIEQIYIFIDLFLYHNGHCMFNTHNILEICFPWKSSGDWLSLYRQYILLNCFFNISGSDQNKTQTTQNTKLGH
jgi:hypothetical protein